MKKWLTRARAALGLGLLWAVGGVAIAAVLELLDNVMPAAHPLTRQVDMWPQLLAILGFLAGTLFGVILGIAAARRRFDELSLPLFTTLGAGAGLVLGLLLGAPVPVASMLTLASALGGAGSLALARRAERRELSGVGARVPEVERTEHASRRLPPE
jgi:O-antigen/teichoic acid export membrane protein